GRLQVAALLRANPDFGVCRRNRQLANAIEDPRLGDWLAVGAQIVKDLAAFVALDTRLGIGNIDQAVGTGVLVSLHHRLGQVWRQLTHRLNSERTTRGCRRALDATGPTLSMPLQSAITGGPRTRLF